ncbi:MAG: hypothetical protein CMJ83_16060 [Planctomycetes bacterium]|nr:hypothetical protein [Planctomycetota bacterium]
MDAKRKATKGRLGFTIHRTDHTEDEAYYLRGGLTFKETHRGEDHPSVLEHPIQDFKWGDYSAKPNHRYTYKITPAYGTPKNITHSRRSPSPSGRSRRNTKEHTVYFNRGVAGSQAFAQKFPEITKKDLDGQGDNDNAAAVQWLSRGLLEGMCAFIAKAKGKDWGLRVCIFEFTFQPVLDELRKAHLRKADVQVLNDQKSKALREENLPAIAEARISGLVTPRKAAGQGLGHNKFIVLLHKGRPVELWTGSTNIAEWHEEKLTGLNVHVRYVHNKYYQRGSVREQERKHFGKAP